MLQYPPLGVHAFNMGFNDYDALDDLVGDNEGSNHRISRKKHNNWLKKVRDTQILSGKPAPLHSACVLYHDIFVDENDNKYIIDAKQRLPNNQGPRLLTIEYGFLTPQDIGFFRGHFYLPFLGLYPEWREADNKQKAAILLDRHEILKDRRIGMMLEFFSRINKFYCPASTLHVFNNVKISGDKCMSVIISHVNTTYRQVKDEKLSEISRSYLKAVMLLDKGSMLKYDSAISDRLARSKVFLEVPVTIEATQKYKESSSIQRARMLSEQNNPYHKENLMKIRDRAQWTAEKLLEWNKTIEDSLE